MYAIIKTGGKQYTIMEGDVIDVELLNNEESEQVEFQDVLFFQNDAALKVGQPNVPGCVVKGEVLGKVRGEKIVSVKYKPRQRQRKKFGHRQDYHRVKITGIELKEGS